MEILLKYIMLQLNATIKEMMLHNIQIVLLNVIYLLVVLVKITLPMIVYIQLKEVILFFHSYFIKSYINIL